MPVWPRFEPSTNLISSGQTFKEQLNHKARAQHPVNEIHPFTREILMSLLCAWEGIMSLKRQVAVPAVKVLSLVIRRPNFPSVKSAWLQVNE